MSNGKRNILKIKGLWIVKKYLRWKSMKEREKYMIQEKKKTVLKSTQINLEKRKREWYWRNSAKRLRNLGIRRERKEKESEWLFTKNTRLC